MKLFIQEGPWSLGPVVVNNTDIIICDPLTVTALHTQHILVE